MTCTVEWLVHSSRDRQGSDWERFCKFFGLMVIEMVI